MILIMIIIYCNQRNNDQHDNNDDTSECKASSPGFGHHDNKVGLKYTIDTNDDHDINCDHGNNDHHEKVMMI